MIFETSWDDGCVEDLEIARLLKRYGLSGTFYIPIDRQLDWYLIKQYIASDFEIGCHTITHPMDLKLLDDEHLEAEIWKAKLMLESIFDRGISKFCYPRGRYDDRVIHFVKKAGFSEARTTEVLRIDKKWAKHKKPTSIHAFNRKEYDGVGWSIMAYRLFDEALENDGYFHIWGHGWEINKNNDWEALEAFFKYASRNLKRK